MSRSTLIILIAFFVSSVTVHAATIALKSSDVTDVDKTDQSLPLARQATDDHYAEDYEEDDEEDEAQQLQQNLFTQQQKQEEEDQEESDEDADDDDELDLRYRKRREVMMAAPVVETATNSKLPTNEEKEEIGEDTQNAAAIPAVSPPETAVELNSTSASVLILIRQALKKVITELPTQQVATNALQYFQLFEHFLQQTIEQLIDDDEDEVAEVSTPITSVSALEQAHSVEPEPPSPSVESPEPSGELIAAGNKPGVVNLGVDTSKDETTLIANPNVDTPKDDTTLNTI